MINKSIHSKIFLTFVLVLLLPVVIVSVSSYLISVQILKNKVSDSYIETAMFIGNGIEQDLYKLEQLNDFIYTNTKNYTYLMEHYNSTDESYLDFKSLNDSFDNYFSYVGLSPYISIIALLGNNNALFLYGNESIQISSQSMQHSDWYDNTLALNGKINWMGMREVNTMTGGKRMVVAFARVIKDADFTRPIGISFVAVDNQFFSNSLRKANMDLSNEILLLDGAGRTVYRTGSEKVNQAFEDMDQLQGDSGGSYISTEQGEKYLVAYQYISRYDWWVVEKIPYSELIKDNQNIFYATLWICSICFLLFAVIMYFISSAIVKPIKMLTRTMRGVRNGNLNVRSGLKGEDEMGVLGQSFDYMLDQINELIASIVNEQNLKRDAEYKALQAQINPHFLYNTLNTIRWMAIIKKEDSIKAVVEALGRLLRNTTGKMDSYISVKEELDNLEDYVFIQKLRYREKFEVNYDIHSDCLDCQCIKFMLQPLVENAIFHGIEPKEGRGTIWIRAELDNNLLIFHVRDDGVGMPRQQIDIILYGASDERNRFNGIGIKNIDDRIKMEYGSLYGVEIDSKENEYTDFKLTLPIKNKPPD